MTDYDAIEVPPRPTTDEEFAALPILSLNDFYTRQEKPVTHLKKLSSATKYPSIPTYHLMDQGILQDGPIVFPPGTIYGTEKVDGTNARMVFMPDGQDYFIGSREFLIYAKGDRVINPVEGIVEALKPIADRLTSGNHEGFSTPYFRTESTATVVFAEVYGHKIGGSGNADRNYTSTQEIGVRMFDVCSVELSEMDKLSDEAAVATWRDHQSGQHWYNEYELEALSKEADIPLVPRVLIEDAIKLPYSLQDTHAFLADAIPQTLVGLDVEGPSEGLVVRTEDRSVIVKMRFQDYEKTFRRLAGNKR